jgi:periplasmic divalent cation tolerance protein
MTDKRLVLTTVGSESEARKIAHTLVERHLAACVNIIPRVGSVYRWKGEIEESEEYLLVIKTAQGREEEVRNAIRELHSYELPECISIPIESGSAEYLKWISDSIEQ